MMSKGPRYFSESFFEDWMVWKNFAFTKVLSPEFRRKDPVLVCGLLIAFLKLLNIDLELTMEFSVMTSNNVSELSLYSRSVLSEVLLSTVVV
jgi:hypothetical protein